MKNENEFVLKNCAIRILYDGVPLQRELRQLMPRRLDEQTMKVDLDLSGYTLVSFGSGRFRMYRKLGNRTQQHQQSNSNNTTAPIHSRFLQGSFSPHCCCA
jgi:hypothetical protein